MAKRYHGKHDKMIRDVEHDGRSEGDGGEKKFMKHAGGMINDDRNAPANLPRHIIDSYYPAAQYGIDGGIDDLFDGAQKQMSVDKSDLRRAFKPGKY